MDPFGLGLRPGEPKASVHRRLLQVPFAVATLAARSSSASSSAACTTPARPSIPSAPNDYVGDGTGSVQIEVHPGDSLSAIGQTLVQRGVVKTVTAFSDAANDVAQARAIQPGRYQLRLQMSALSAVTLW